MCAQRTKIWLKIGDGAILIKIKDDMVIKSKKAVMRFKSLCNVRLANKDLVEDRGWCDLEGEQVEKLSMLSKSPKLDKVCGQCMVDLGLEE